MDNIVYALFVAFLAKEFGDRLFTETEKDFLRAIIDRQENKMRQLNLLVHLAKSGEVHLMSKN